MERRRVLIVEDETLIALELKDHLESHYYTVCGMVTRGEEVLDRIDEFRPDLIMMDINLAGSLTGIDTAAQLKGKIDIPIVYVTAYSDAGIVERAAKTGPYGYLLKPFIASEVYATIETALHRHAMECRVSESERRLRALFEQAAVGIAEIDSRTGLFVRVNLRYRELFGYAPDALSLADIRLEIDAESVQVERQRMAALLDGSIREYTIEKRCVRPDGRTVWVQVTVSSLWKPGEPATSYVVIAQDMTERKRLEAQLMQAQKMEALGRLVGGIAHDFNNLLTGINGNAELALEQLNASSPIRSRLETIWDAGTRAARLTNQLLAFSRRQPLRPEVLDVNAEVSKSAEIIPRIIGESIRLVLTLAPDAGLVRIDRSQLDQVLLNLAVNARDAMPSGGVLTIETQCADGPDRMVRLIVRDTGHGFSEDVQARLFDPFFTTKEFGRGTGLGLSIVHGIVMHNGGKIEAGSVPGSGATFTMTFPRVEPVAVAQPATESASAEVQTILLVEDEPTVREITTEMLTMQGYHVLAAETGDDAIRQVESYPGKVHLLLTDVILPGTNGRELAERIKTMLPNLAVVFMSGYNEDELLRYGIREGSVTLLPKPFTADALSRVIKRALGGQLVAVIAIGANSMVT